MNLASENGLSIMRPLFMDFPADAACWEVEDSFMFGSDLLVAPITRHDQHERQVYLPAAVRWTDAWTGETFAGRQTVTVLAPLDHIPAFWREGSQWEFLFSAV
jgi:alpha-D-xyloside xylohydrolase